MNANQAQLTTGGTKLWRKMEEERVLEDRTWESMKKGYSRIMKNQQLQGDEKEETAEEDIMDGTEIEDGEENVDHQVDLEMWEVEEEVEEVHTAYIFADI